MALKSLPDITPEQLEDLRARKKLHLIHLRDFLEVFGQDFPVARAVSRQALPPDLHVDASFLVSSQELFLVRIEDILQDFLSDLKEALKPQEPPKP